jgi:uncharacterized protein YkwD
MTARTRIRRTAARLSVAACALTLLLAAPAAADDTASLADIEAAVEAQIVEFINRERVDAGLAPLEVWPDNSLAAEATADRVAGGEPHALLDRHAAAYRERGATGASETQHHGVGRAGAVVVGWRNSDEHNRIMLDERVTHVAVAADCDATPRRYTAQFVATAPSGGDTPVADTPAAVDRGAYCTDTPPREGADGQALLPSSEQMVEYLPHAAGGLAALLLLRLGLRRRSANRAEARRAAARADDDAMIRAEQSAALRSRAGRG